METKGRNTMPSIPRITKDMILSTVLEITRETGFEGVKCKKHFRQAQILCTSYFTGYEDTYQLRI